jgi:DNA-binding PadR family transcriptional regulator
MEGAAEKKLPLSPFERNLLRTVSSLEQQGDPVYTVPIRRSLEQTMHRMVIYPSVYSGLEKLEKGKYISTRLGEVLPGRTMKNPATIVALEPAGRELLTHISPEIEPVPRISLAGRGRALLRIVTHGRFGREKNTPIPDNRGKSD